jgi:hypothetical protein
MGRRLPSRALIRERLLDAAYAARDHDAYWCRPTAGWRAVRDYATAAGRGDYVAAPTAEQILEALVSEGTLERRDGREYRHREPVTPYGGDERMRQP